MPEVLFIDGCMRGWEVSRTYAVAEKFVEIYRQKHPEDHVEELHLSEEDFSFFGSKEVERNTRLSDEGQFNAPEFAMARKFAAADKILLAAPLWNMGLPAAVHAYLENVSIVGVSFIVAEKGMTGRCAAKKFLCIMTSGSEFGEDSDDRAIVHYLRSLCNMLGIEETTHLWIEGLDLEDGLQDERMASGMQQAAEFAETW